MHLKEEVVCVGVILAHLPTAVSGGKGLGYSMPSYHQSEIAATVMSLMCKCYLDNYLALLPDIPCTPNKDNSITGTVVEDQSWCLQRDGLAD